MSGFINPKTLKAYVKAILDADPVTTTIEWEGREIPLAIGAAVSGYITTSTSLPQPINWVAAPNTANADARVFVVVAYKGADPKVNEDSRDDMWTAIMQAFEAKPTLGILDGSIVTAKPVGTPDANVEFDPPIAWVVVEIQIWTQ